MNGCQLPVFTALRGAEDEQQNGDQLDQHHGVVGLGAFADAAHQDVAQHHQNDERRQIEPRAGALALLETSAATSCFGKWKPNRLSRISLK